MYTIKQYLENIILLTSSLVIKHHNIGTVINTGLFVNNGLVPPEDYHEWKYYLNLSGQKHSTNNDVLITLVETDEVVSLTKDILIEYPGTQEELDSRLSSYKALIKEYPNDIAYINGCINPVDIDEAIAAPDGAIVGWSKLYVEPQEYSLIRELSEEIRLFFSRWYIREYNITDELYMASVLAVLYTTIPGMISNIRMKDSFTSEANSFHVEHFFRSHLDLWDNVKYLKKTTIWWLYTNLIPLINNVGTNETFNTVVDKIFTANGIGLGKYTLTRDTLTYNNTSDITLPAFEQSQALIRIDPLNEYFRTIDNTLSIPEIVKLEIANTEVNPYTEEVVLDTLTNDTVRTVGELVTVEQPTKVIDFGRIDLFKIYNNNLVEAILDTWLQNAFADKYIYNTVFTDPNTKINYELDAKTGISLFYYLLFNKFGDTNPNVQYMRYRNILVNKITTAELELNTLSATGTNYVAGIISESLPRRPARIRNANDFSKYIEKQINLYQKVWSIDSNVNNMFLSANIKNMVFKVYKRGSINLLNRTGYKLVDFLTNSGINITIDAGYDIDLTLVKLFKEFTGYDIHREVLLAGVYDNLRGLLNKLSSYTVQTIPPDIQSNDTESPYSTIAVNQTDTAYIQVRDASVISPYEPISGGITAGANDFWDNAEASISGENSLELFQIGTDPVIVGYSEDVAIAHAVDLKGVLHVELLRDNYNPYAPNTMVEANTELLMTQGFAQDAGIAPNVTVQPTSNDVLVESYNQAVGVDVSINTEIIGSNYQT